MNFLIFTPIILILFSLFEIIIFNEEVLLSLVFFTFIYFCFNQYNSSIHNSSIRFKASITKPLLKDVLTNYQLQGSSIQVFQSSTTSLLTSLKYSCCLDIKVFLKDFQLSTILFDTCFSKAILSSVSSFPLFLNINSNTNAINSMVNLSSQFTVKHFNFIVSLLSFVKPTKSNFFTY
jgi:hypothetical protein